MRDSFAHWMRRVYWNANEPWISKVLKTRLILTISTNKAFYRQPTEESLLKSLLKVTGINDSVLQQKANSCDMNVALRLGVLSAVTTAVSARRPCYRWMCGDRLNQSNLSLRLISFESLLICELFLMIAVRTHKSRADLLHIRKQTSNHPASQTV